MNKPIRYITLCAYHSRTPAGVHGKGEILDVTITRDLLACEVCIDRDAENAGVAWAERCQAPLVEEWIPKLVDALELVEHNDPNVRLLRAKKATAAAAETWARRAQRTARGLERSRARRAK